VTSKSISITPAQKRSGRGLPSSIPTNDIDDLPTLSPQRRTPPRPTTTQPVHRYHIGERLRMTNGGSSISRRESFCKVTGILPYEGRGALLYRVRSDSEQFERVVIEADLSRNSDATS